jgi:hypothetical protein
MPSIPPLSVGHWQNAEPPDTEDVPAPELEPETRQGATVHLMPIQGAQTSWLEQSNYAILHSLRMAWKRTQDFSRREGNVIHGLLRAKPESLAEHSAYVSSRAWVPPAHEGGIAERAGVAYGRTIAPPAIALFNAGSAIAARPLRGTIAFLTTYLLTGVALYALGHHAAAEWMIAGLLAAAALTALVLWLSGRSPEQQNNDTEEGM